MKIPVPDVLLPAEDLGRVHFVGIGGAALSAIARIMAARGMAVSGSDDNDTPFLAGLRELGVPCHLGYAAEHVDGADTLVVTTAAREDNPEVLEGRRRGLRILPRSAGLWSVMAGQRVVAVAGTHGKTTTTSLLVSALVAAGADPTYAVGGVLASTGHNAEVGAGDLFVAEADESDGAFLVYQPVRRGGHQRRGRPPRRVGDRGGVPLGVRGVRRRPSTRTASWCAASTTRAPGTWRTHARSDGPTSRHRRRGGRRRRARHRPGVRGHDVPLHRRSAATRCSAPSRCGSPAATTSSTPSPRWSPASSSATTSPACARGSRRSPAPGRRMEAKGEAGGRPRLRQLRPPPRRDRRRPRGRARGGGGGPAGRGLPAAPGLAHPRVRRGHGRRAGRGRRGRRARRLRRARGARPRRDRAVSSRTPYLCPPSWSPSCPGSRRPRPSSSPGPGPATSCSPSARAASPPSGPRVLELLAAG